MSPVASSAWLDGFLAADALIVAALVLTDWLIGQQGRRRIRNVVCDWWIVVKAHPWGGLSQRDAKRILRLISRLQGERWRSLRALAVSGVLVAPVVMLGYLLALGILIHQDAAELGLFRWEVTAKYTSELASHDPWAAVALYPVLTIATWLSIGGTRMLLRPLLYTVHATALVVATLASWLVLFGLLKLLDEALTSLTLDVLATGR